MKRLTIITINYNNCDGLLRTIESVLSQSVRKEFEYIVIDGGSDDGSLDVIRQNESNIDYWVSERDSGIYNAMNKGVIMGGGSYCLFLNSGDWLINNSVIERIMPFLNNESDIISSFTWSEKNGILQRRKFGSPDFHTFITLVNNSIDHPSAFIRRELLLNEPYDETLLIISDWKFFLIQYIKGARFRHVDLDVSIFDTTGISASSSELLQSERKRVLSEFVNEKIVLEYQYVPAEVAWQFNSIKTSYRLQKFIVSIIRVIIRIYGFIFPKRVCESSMTYKKFEKK